MRHLRTFHAFVYFGFGNDEALTLVRQATLGDAYALRLARTALRIMQDVWVTP